MDNHSVAANFSEAAIARRERRPVSLRAYVLRESGDSSEVLVLDLSYEGCGIETPLALDPEEKVKLTVLGRGAIDARVRWSTDGKAGLVFDPEETAPEQHSPRASHRVPLSADVSLRRLGQANFRVSVTDLSPEGCRVELVDRPRVDEHVLVKFEGLEVLEAQVCWIDGYVAGLRFEKPIHAAVFELLLDRLQ